MTKIRRLSPTRIRKIPGGKDPVRLVEDFMVRRGFDPEECLQQRTNDIATWSVPIVEGEELEVTLEGLHLPAETTLYLGLNIFEVPLRNAQNVLAAALNVADTLIGAKLSLINHDIVISVTAHTAEMNPDELDYFFELIARQKDSVKEALTQEVE